MTHKFLIVPALTLAFLSGCTSKTEAEILADFKRVETQSCVTSWSSKDKQTSTSIINSVCTCSIDKLASAYPVKTLQKMGAGNASEMQVIMVPVVKECIAIETAKFGR